MSLDIFHRRLISNESAEIPSDLQTVTMVTYNILAECHLRLGDYSYTQEEFLTQEYRHDLLLKELAYLDADIVCFQEVAPKYYETLLRPALMRNGFEGTFIKRPRPNLEEGSATFYKTDLFSLVEFKGIRLLDQLAKDVKTASLDEDTREAIESYIHRYDVINICRLQSKKTGKVLTLGNVHVVWDDLKSPDIQTLEIASAVKELVAMAATDNSPYIICGDFNSKPTSIGYQLARDGYLSDSSIATLQGFKNLQLQSGPVALVDCMRHAFQINQPPLESAYNTCQNKEPEVTAYDATAKECLDYLFYEKTTLGVLNVLEAVDVSAVEGGMPTETIPADHLSLKATFYFK